MVQFIRLGNDFGLGFGFYRSGRTPGGWVNINQGPNPHKNAAQNALAKSRLSLLTIIILSHFYSRTQFPVTNPIKHGRNYFVRRLHYAAGEVRSYTLYFPMHRRVFDKTRLVSLAKDPSGRADGRKQPVGLLDTYRCAKASTKSCGPARPRPAPVAREAPSPTPL